jgi:S1-C subfamily serine protease
MRTPRPSALGRPDDRPHDHLFLRLLLALALMLAAGAVAAAPADDPQAASLSRASDAVVGVQVKAVDGAVSADTLGKLRSGSGVVISDDGLVLTIGYLILEADQLQLVLDDGRVLPARVVGYDQATGFGLVQSLVPLNLAPVPMGDTSQVQTDEPLMVVSGGEDGGISIARLLSRRAFSGYWEYHIDGALFTAPARTDHSGAALFNAKGELLGVGSLLMANANDGGGPRMPGNMFVPVNLLKPILGELRAHGRVESNKRAWMGVNCVEQDGAVRVVRVSSRSPAERAGVQPGDRIERIDGHEVAALATLWQRLWDGGAAEREVTLDIRRGAESRQLRMTTIDRGSTYKHAEGI